MIALMSIDWNGCISINKTLLQHNVNVEAPKKEAPCIIIIIIIIMSFKTKKVVNRGSKPASRDVTEDVTLIMGLQNHILRHLLKQFIWEGQ